MNDRLSRIRENEKKSHTEIYTNDEAFGEALKKLEARL